MIIKELIEKLNKYDGKKEIVIRFAVSNKDELGYVLIPKILDEYGTEIAIYANYEHTKEDCDFMGQVDLKGLYEKEVEQMSIVKNNYSMKNRN